MNKAPKHLYVCTKGAVTSNFRDGIIFASQVPSDNLGTIEYRRADLPATDAQIMDNPKVQALKRHLEIARLWLDVDGRFDLQGIDAALAALEADDE